MVIQVVILDHFLGVELDIPKKQFQAIIHIQFLLCLVDHPNIKIRRLVNDFLDVKNKVTHSLSSSHLFVEVSSEHVADTLHLLVEGGQFTWNLLN